MATSAKTSDSTTSDSSTSGSGISGSGISGSGISGSSTSDSGTHSTGDRRAGTSDDARSRRLGRAATVIGSTLVTTGIFAIIRAAGADFTITDPGEGKIPHTFVAAEIAMVTAILGVLGWATLALLERWTRRPHLIWSTLALVIVLLSLVPIWIERATSPTRLGLVIVHVVVGLALLPLLRWKNSSRPAPRA